MSQNISPNVEPQTRKFLERVNAQGGKPLYELSPQEARKVLSDLQSGDVEKLPADVEERTLPGGPRNKGVSVTIVRPRGSEEALPVVMYFHGGGWVLGGWDTHERLVRELVNGTQAAFVFVNYTLAPEAQYPVQIEEAYAATEWISENGESLNLDTSRLVVAGDSVGGNMATVVALMAKERGGPHIEFQHLFYPVTNSNFETGSYKEFATGHWLLRDAMRWFWENSLPTEEERALPHASPLRASLEQLKGMPPTLLIVGENDMLRDEGEAYARKLAKAGVRVVGTRYLGAIHDFVMLNALANTSPTRAAIRQACDTLRYVLGQEARGMGEPLGHERARVGREEPPAPMTH